MVGKCPSTNTAEIEQDQFFLNFHFNNQLQPHEIGWLIAGAAAAITCILSLSNVIAHAHTYTRPLEQRQIIRILLFAPIYAVVSFFGYRYFREYEYFELGEVAMEAIAISAFLILLLQYIGDALEDQRAVFGKKEKTKMPFPFNCWRYRPSKAYFLVLLKWSVLQYVLIRPLLSIAGVILQYFDLLCTQTYSYKYGEVYLAAVDFVSISIALYGLIVLYALLREDLNGRKPLSKFLTIKLAIFFTFYQSFVFGILQDHGILKETEYWTSTNIANGLNALCTSLEMIIVAVWQLFAFPASEYSLKNLAKPRKIPKKKNKKKGKKQKEGESNEDDDNVGEGAQDMELSHTPNEQSAIATQGALPGHSPSALDEFDRNNNNNNFLAPPQRPPINHAHTPSFLQQQSQQDRLRGESHVIPGTSVGRTNARGHTNILRSLLHALNLSDFAVELWHSLRFAIDRIRGKEYTREDMRFGKGKFDFMVFQQHEREGGGRAGDGSMGVQPMGDHRLLTSATGPGLALGSAAASGRAEMSGYTNSYYSGSTAHPGRAPSVAGTLDSSQLHQNNVVGGIGGGGPGPSSLSRMMASSSSNTDVGAGGGGKDAGSYQPLQDRMDSPAQGRGYALPPAEAGYGNHQQGQEQYEMYAPTQYHNYTFSGGGNAGAGGMGVPRQSMSGTATSTAVDSLGSPVVAHSPLGAGAGAGPGITGFYERNSQGQKVEIGGPSPSNSAATTLNGVGRKSMNAARDSTEVRMNSFAFPNSSSASSVRSAGAGAGRNGEDGGDEGIYGGVEGPPMIVYPAGQGEGEGMYPHQHQHQAQIPDARFSGSMYDEDEGNSARASGVGSMMGQQYQHQQEQQLYQPATALALGSPSDLRQLAQGDGGGLAAQPQQQQQYPPAQDGYYGYHPQPVIQEGGAYFSNASPGPPQAQEAPQQQQQQPSTSLLPRFSIHPPPPATSLGSPVEQQTMDDLRRAMALTPAGSVQEHRSLSPSSSDAGAGSQGGGGGGVLYDEYGRPLSWEPQAM